MTKKIKKQSPNNMLVNSIINIVIPDLKKYEKDILGIYLVPCKIGDSKKLEITFIKKDMAEFFVEKKETIVNHIKIYPFVNSLEDYDDFHFQKDLKSGFIIYDPHKILELEILANSKCQSTTFINSFPLPDDIVKTVKSRIYSYQK